MKLELNEDWFSKNLPHDNLEIGVGIAPSTHPMSMQAKTLDRNEAEQAGYAVFNNGTHLCVDVPDGLSTITCRTSDGKLVTFAFCPFETEGVPKIVDIMHHNTDRYVKNGSRQVPTHLVSCRTVGRLVFVGLVRDQITLTTLSL